MPEPKPKSALTDELQRLKAKMAAVDDRDIKQALQLKIDSVQASLDAVDAREEEAEKEEPVNLEPSTPEQIRKADELIRQARVEKIRKNQNRSLELMKQAAEVAPNAPAVLEALGDDYTERRNHKAAVAAYARAKLFSKNNVPLENKHANAVLRAKGMSNFDAAMRMEGSDPMFLTPESSPARVGVARVLNAFLPGVGHIVIGKTVAGLCLVGASVIWLIWIAAMGKDLNALLHFVLGKASQPNLLILAPIFGYVITWLIGIGSVGGQDSLHKQKKNVHRPVPPVNLPFE